MDTKPHAELPPLERTREYKDAATQWAEEFDWSDTDWEYVAEEQHANFICRTMQLLAALQSIAALTARAEAVENKLSDARQALIYSGRYAGCFLADTVSTEFLMGVPDEVHAVISKLTARAEKSERERDEAKRLHNLRAELHDRAVIAAEAAEADCEVWRKAGVAQQKRAEAAEAELAAVHKRLDAISEEDRMTRNANS